MRIIKAAALVAILSSLSLSTQAMSIKYDLTLSDIGFGTGTGSFMWDAGILSMTQLMWDFGAGQTGGTTDAVLANTPFPEDTSIGAFLFESITGLDVTSAIGCESGGFGLCSISFSDIGLTGTFPSVDILFEQTGQYSIDDGAGRIGPGSVTASAVPVPAAVWLFGSALGLLAWIRRRAP